MRQTAIRPWLSERLRSGASLGFALIVAVALVLVFGTDALSISTVANTTMPTTSGSTQPVSVTAVVSKAVCMNGTYPKASWRAIMIPTHSHETPFVVNSSRRRLLVVLKRLANR